MNDLCQGKESGGWGVRWESNLVYSTLLLLPDIGHLAIFPFTPVLCHCKRERRSDFFRLMFIKESISGIKILVGYRSFPD